MKKYLSILLSVMILTAMVAVPMLASATVVYENKHIYLDRSSGFGNNLTGGYTNNIYHSNVSTLANSWNIDVFRFDAETSFSALPSTDESGVLTLTSGASSQGKLKFMREKLEAPTNAISTTIRKMTETLTLTSTNDEEKQIWPTLRVTSAQKLKTIYTTGPVYEKLSELRATDQVLYFFGGAFDSANPYGAKPICEFKSGVPYTITYIYDNRKTVKSLSIKEVGSATDGTITTLMDGTTAVSGLSLGTHGGCVLNDMEYQEYGVSADVYSVEKTVEDSQTTLSVSSLKFEAVEPVQLSISKIEVNNQPVDDGFTMSPSGQIRLTWNGVPGTVTVTLEEGSLATLKTPAITTSGNISVISFENMPLSAGASYSMIIKNDNEQVGDAITFTATVKDDKYYIDENFSRYTTATNINTFASSGANKIWNFGATNGNGLTKFVIEEESSGNVLAFGVDSTKVNVTTSSFYAALKRKARTLPSLSGGSDYANMKEWEFRFSFSELEGNTKLRFLQEFFYIVPEQNNGNSRYYLYAAPRTGSAWRIAEVFANKPQTIRFTYEATGPQNRSCYKVLVNGVEYIPATPFGLTTHGGHPLENYVANYNADVSVFGVDIPKETNLTKNVDLKLYSVKYSAYTNEESAEYMVTAGATQGEGSINTTVIAQDYAGIARTEIVVLAVYTNEDDRLLDTIIVPVSLSKLGKQTSTGELMVGTETSYYVKQFRFNDMNNLQPLDAPTNVVIS